MTQKHLTRRQTRCILLNVNRNSNLNLLLNALLLRRVAVGF
jgi:hypothetical protein